MHQPQRPVEKGEERVKDALGGFLGAGLEEVHITFLPRSIGQISVAQFCLDAGKAVKQNPPLGFWPATTLRHVHTRATGIFGNLVLGFATLWVPKLTTQGEVGLTLLTQNHSGKQSLILYNYLFAF